MNYYTYKFTLRSTFFRKFNVFFNTHCIPFINSVSVFVNLADIDIGDSTNMEIWQALFIIDLFTGRKASIYKRGYRDIYNRRGSGRRRLFRIEVGAVLRKKIAYDFLYFLFSFIMDELEEGRFSYFLVDDKMEYKSVFFIIEDVEEIVMFLDRPELIG